ncbi:MAG: ATP-dependent helicase [Prevotellaceae bacterium]|jgi:superfamily I DNA/RNA helicase|nr:ATP-dependent helicase [Prevotellaceae bacterium]
MAFEINSDDILTTEQLKNHIKVYAGPGAGKTHFLVENVKNIVVTNSLVAKNRARKVLCITYTNAAVDEIKRRLDRFSTSVEVYTIHGFIIEHIIKPFQDDLREIIYDNFHITISGKGKITSQVEGLGILHGVEREDIYKYINDGTEEKSELNYSKKTMGDVEVDNGEFLSTGKVELKASSSVIEQHYLPIKQYVWSIVKKLTHDEILFFGYQILLRNPTALYATRIKFPFIFVDEFQDTNPLQTLLIKLIGEKSTTIGIIGDVAQSIYNFQGAKPSQFLGFNIDGEKIVNEYAISNNRRSTANIVNFCNFLRQSDSLTQNSVRCYKQESDRAVTESKKIHFMMGETSAISAKIRDIINDGGVVLTRAWAATFAYIQNVDSQQTTLLRNIYSAYYNSPIQIREEIIEHNNVTWVRAFKFIFWLWEAHQKGSFVDVIKALSLYAKIDKKKFTASVVLQIKELVDKLFETNPVASLTVNKIDEFNAELTNDRYFELRSEILEENEFKITIFTEYDDRLKPLVSQLNWETSYKLFTEVFSNNSRYMTVHQAKGFEWDKVIISVVPSSRNDKTDLASVYTSPQLLEETPAEEFTRIYYVACRRAKEDLYIHINGGISKEVIENNLRSYIQKTGNKIEYEFI